MEVRTNVASPYLLLRWRQRWLLLLPQLVPRLALQLVLLLVRLVEFRMDWSWKLDDDEGTARRCCVANRSESNRCWGCFEPNG